ncbi:Demethylmenaquinone methyltransferase [Roseivivax jejudonensis]|uniref:Demethylmenaquinone methyltransferase n=1 Tax=Roseivivax jejudonensis TaxID=1529041 RepID=A0A1X6ZCR2_9RHOB|nr:methyltransferase domain-containing protein [Roseivivax jejudonensis]SLN45938.1 Demethylmenaquinone methyltransferase [Roseivivax jejudonensis]
MLQFDAETAGRLELAYSGADITYRRRASFDAVAPRPGQHVVDIGCGNGMLTAELARAVGTSGRVTGIDPSADMRALAERRCADFTWVTLSEGRADALPLPDCIADTAVSVQVFEYIDDVPGALAEARRILRPGGRLVIADMHFGTFAWFSENGARMQRVIDAWDHHFVHRALPERLPALMTDAGFDVERVVPVTITDTDLKPDGLANMMLILMADFAARGGHVSAAEARAWAAEQHTLADAGRFFFTFTQFVTTARRP